MKLILILVLVALCGCVGFKISSNYKQRQKFFQALNFFLQSFKTEINFTSNRLLKIIEHAKNTIKSKELNTLLDNYSVLIQNGHDFDNVNLFSGINFLKQQEKETIFIFFKELGKTDVYNQTDSISNMQNICSEFLLQTKKDCDKYCSLYTKLGVLFGLFIALIIV
ncbi:MAG: hypothetical protein E7376_00460 [Clostridiales bacterium]|nr:hypothetical protein [Clostridiales bacterium]